MTHYDHLIVGQGLAGTALAWTLIERGRTVCIIDREEAVTSSKIAAGLMTPITGQRLVKQDRWEELIATALPFYRRVEAATGMTFLREPGSVRIFADVRERGIFERRSPSEFAGMVRNPQPSVDADTFSVRHGSFEMTAACQLLCAPYLRVSRDYFEEHHRCIRADLDPAADLEVDRERIIIRNLDISSGGLTFCLGFAGGNQPAFAAKDSDPNELPVQVEPGCVSSRSTFGRLRVLRELTQPGSKSVPSAAHCGSNFIWQAAKGEILTLLIPGLTEERIINSGVWLAPVGDGLFRSGSTYEWHELDNRPTESKRDEIVSRLKLLLKRPFEIVDHRAAVRPILRDQMPAIGADPELPGVYHFNGLGSKGALLAPWVAARLADHIEEGAAIPPKYALARFRSRPAS